jgi:hypothetical protein
MVFCMHENVCARMECWRVSVLLLCCDFSSRSAARVFPTLWSLVHSLAHSFIAFSRLSIDRLLLYVRARGEIGDAADPVSGPSTHHDVHAPICPYPSFDSFSPAGDWVSASPAQSRLSITALLPFSSDLPPRAGQSLSVLFTCISLHSVCFYWLGHPGEMHDAHTSFCFNVINELHSWVAGYLNGMWCTNIVAFVKV